MMSSFISNYIEYREAKKFARKIAKQMREIDKRNFSFDSRNLKENYFHTALYLILAQKQGEFWEDLSSLCEKRFEASYVTTQNENISEDMSDLVEAAFFNNITWQTANSMRVALTANEKCDEWKKKVAKRIIEAAQKGEFSSSNFSQRNSFLYAAILDSSLKLCEEKTSGTIDSFLQTRKDLSEISVICFPDEETLLPYEASSYRACLAKASFSGAVLDKIADTYIYKLKNGSNNEVYRTKDKEAHFLFVMKKMKNYPEKQEALMERISKLLPPSTLFTMAVSVMMGRHETDKEAFDEMAKNIGTFSFKTPDGIICAITEIPEVSDTPIIYIKRLGSEVLCLKDDEEKYYSYSDRKNKEALTNFEITQTEKTLGAFLRGTTSGVQQAEYALQNAMKEISITKRKTGLLKVLIADLEEKEKITDEQEAAKMSSDLFLKIANWEPTRPAGKGQTVQSAQETL